MEELCRWGLALRRKNLVFLQAAALSFSLLHTHGKGCEG